MPEINPFISVIIPVYNKAPFIEATLKTVISQSYTDFEILIIDDGSTDESAIIVRSFFNLEGKEIDYTFISRQNIGLSHARNTGLQNAKGQLVFFLDADDLWHTDFLNRMVQLYKYFPDANCFGSRFKRFRKLNQISKTTKKKGTALIEDYFKTNQYNPLISQSSYGFKRSLFPDISYDESIDYAEDIDIYIQLFQTQKLAIDYTELAYVRTHVKGQLTTSNFNQKNIVNLSKYETKAIKNKSLKQYIDFYRYCFGSDYKALGNSKAFKKITAPIQPKNISRKQKTLLVLPQWLLQLVKVIKRKLV